MTRSRPYFLIRTRIDLPSRAVDHFDETADVRP